MSEKNARKLRFLSQHPVCCFCGGRTPAAEPDHVPGRVFFRDRQWPVGYEFPACFKCNHTTSLDEQAVAMLARIYPDPTTPKEKEAMKKLMREVGNNHPGLLEEMQPSIRQLRAVKSKYGLVQPSSEPITALPALSVSGPLVNGAVHNFARKLFCALFYKHAEQVVNLSGAIGFRWFSNLQINADEIPRSFANVIPNMPKLERNAKPLDDQFFYRWGITDTERMAAFLAFFNQSFAMMGVVRQDSDDLSLPEGALVLKPYKWQ